MRIIRVRKQPNVAECEVNNLERDELKKVLTKLRNKKGLTHEQVAILVSDGNKKITRQYYGMIENGSRRPSVEVAKSIAKILEIKWTIFFEVKGNQTLQEKPEEVV